LVYSGPARCENYIEQRVFEKVLDLPTRLYICISAMNGKVKRDEEYQTLKAPFRELNGESLLHMGRISKSTFMALSDYRLIICTNGNVYCIPLGLIDAAELVQKDSLSILCKTASNLRCTFSSEILQRTWVSKISKVLRDRSHVEGLFAFCHMAWSKCHLQHKDNDSLNHDHYTDVFQAEYHRLKFSNEHWRISDLNTNFEDQASGAVIARSGQPQVAFLGYRCAEDESLIRAIAESSTGDKVNEDELTNGMVASACAGSLEDKSFYNNFSPFNMSASLNPLVSSGSYSVEASSSQRRNSFQIIDARSYAAALANRAMGGGLEYPDYYIKCNIEYMNLPNIHALRKSFQTLRALCNQSSDQSSWLANLESTKWFHYLGGLIRTALLVCQSIKASRSVLVHCSDGWDRTSQIVSLAEIMLDPYYRTIEGFIIIIEREWLAFGHKFADRCGHSFPLSESNEQSPVFLQWLDCVHQLMKQFPCSFEFNEALLIKLAYHSYSCLFGTFLFNNVHERIQHKVAQRTKCFWRFVRTQREKFCNFLYDLYDKQVLNPSYEFRDLSFWTRMYFPTSSNTNGSQTMLSRNHASSNSDGYPSALQSNGRDFTEDDRKLHSLDNNNTYQLGNKKIEINRPNDNAYLLSFSDQNVVVNELNDSVAKIDFIDHESENENQPVDENSDKDQHPILKLKAECRESNLSDPPLSPGSIKEYSKRLENVLDVDGLVKFADPVQDRLRDIRLSYHSEIDHLRVQLENAIPGLDSSREVVSREQLVTNLATPSNGYDYKGFSVSVSDELQTWEEVTEEDTKRTLWLPDYAVSNCHDCGVQFWFIIRKHHCRCCGNIFCGICANQFIPVPEEQLFDPVRVCNKCYAKLNES
ncbi:Myotubularin-related protein 3, partial [Trichoplax sp. H2]